MNPIKRLRKEADEADKVSDKDVRVLLKESDDLKQWDGVIRGPPGSPYEDHVFKLLIDVGDRYPLAPPTITFLTKQDQEHGPFVIGSSELLDLVIIGWITLESYIVNTKFDKMEKKSFK